MHAVTNLVMRYMYLLLAKMQKSSFCLVWSILEASTAEKFCDPHRIYLIYLPLPTLEHMVSILHYFSYLYYSIYGHILQHFMCQYLTFL